MALFIVIDGVDEAASVRLTSGFSTASAAQLGEVSVARIQVDDPNGSINITGWRGAYIIETLASPQRIWTGFIGEVSIDRGPYRTGAGRVWNCDAVDVNWNLGRRAIRSTDGKRPAETDLARTGWLMGHASMSGLVANTGLVNLTDNPVNLGEADYIGQYPSDVLADITPVAGKTAWAYYDESAGSVGLFYDLTTAAVRTSSSKISNVLADAGANVYPPLRDASMTRSPLDVYSGIFLIYAKGRRYVSLPATATTYAERDFVATTSRIGGLATAAAYQTAFLANHAAAVDAITVTVELPAANVNDILEGSRLQVKFSHLPGYTTYTYSRVIRRNVAQRDGDSSIYVVTLQLSIGIRKGVDYGRPGSFPAPAGCTALALANYYFRGGDAGTGSTPAVWGSGTPTQGAAFTPTAGNVLLFMGTHRAGSVGATPAGWTRQVEVTSDAFHNGVAAFTKVSDGTETQFTIVTDFPVDWVVYEIAGATTGGILTASVNTHAASATWTSGSVSPTAAGALFIAGIIAGADDTWSGSATPSAGWTEYGDSVSRGNQPHTTTVGQLVTSASGSYNPTTVATASHEYSGVTVGIYCEATSVLPPDPGQWVYGEVVTMSTVGGVSTGTLANVYAGGSVKLRVDGVLISRASYVETGAALTPQTGAIALTWIIDGDEVVTADYQGV